jgi:hypothetical protein
MAIAAAIAADHWFSFIPASSRALQSKQIGARRGNRTRDADTVLQADKA